MKKVRVDTRRESRGWSERLDVCCRGGEGGVVAPLFVCIIALWVLFALFLGVLLFPRLTSMFVFACDVFVKLP